MSACALWGGAFMGACNASSSEYPLRDRVLAAAAPTRTLDLRLDAQASHHPCTLRRTPGAVLDPLVCAGSETSASLDAVSAVLVDVRKALATDTSTDALWSIALVDLLGAPQDVRTLDRVIARLREVAARDTASTDVITHLAIAHLARATAADDPQDLFVALDFAERAAARDSIAPHVRFNRAALLERARLDSMAQAVWSQAAATDDEPWRTEARARQSRIAATAAAERDAARAIIGGGVPDSVAIARQPQLARTWAMDTLVRRWSTLVLADSTAAADTVLSTIAVFGQRIAAHNGDSTVTVIGREVRRVAAGPNAARLARAVRRSATGSRLYTLTEFGAATDTLLAADRDFAALDTPLLASWSRAPQGGVALYRGDYTAANRIFEAMADTAAEHHALAVEARAWWGHGIASFRQGRQGEALRSVERALRSFTQVGELANIGFLRSLVGDSYRGIGRELESARASFGALDALHTTSEFTRRHVVLLSQAQSLTGTAPDAAIVMVREAALMAPRTGVPKDVPESLIRLGWLEAQQHRPASALATLATARAALAPVTDRVIRGRMDAEFARAESEALAAVDPRQARTRQDAVLSYFSDVGIVQDVSSALARRAELQLLLGDSTAAVADLARANTSLDSALARDTSAALRAALLATRADVYRRLVALTLARRDTAAALDFFSRARREEASLPTAAGPAAPGAVRLSYLALDGELIIRASRSGQRAVLRREPVTRQQLAALTSRFVNLLRGDGDSITTSGVAAAIGAHVLHPIRDQLTGATQLRVDGDGVLSQLPFAALPAPDGRPLLSQVTLTYGEAGAPQPGASGPAPRSRALVIGNPTFDSRLFPDLPALRSAANEGAEVARIQGGATVLSGASATRRTLLGALPGAGLLHFAGHARVVGGAGGTSHLVLAQSEGGMEANVLFASEIARLPLRGVGIVVLSSCGAVGQSGSTTSGPVNALASAFLDAGARTVVASQWEADDAGTALLMAEFHRQLRRGLSADAALRAAQREARQADGTPLPTRVWAAFRVFERGGRKG